MLRHSLKIAAIAAIATTPPLFLVMLVTGRFPVFAVIGAVYLLALLVSAIVVRFADGTL